MIVRWSVLVLVCLSFTGVVFAQAATASENAAPVQKKQKDYSKKIKRMRRDVEVLRGEIKKVRSAVSKVSKEARSREGMPRALAELNEKLEGQIANVKALSGELYRISSVQEKDVSKTAKNNEELEKLSEDVRGHEQRIKDLQDELRIIRAVESDRKEPHVPAVKHEKRTEPWQRVLHWRYWGQAACGVALLALIIAL